MRTRVMENVYILADESNHNSAKGLKIRQIKDIIRGNFSAVRFVNQASRIIVIGGDGFMTHCLRTYAHYRIPFWGINCGTVGFLLNEYDDLTDSVSESEFIKFPLLHATIYLRDGTIKEVLAFNDVYTDTKPGQAAKHILEVDGINILKKRFDEEVFTGDGLIVTTPGGCTAYNIAAGGMPIIAEDNIFGITPICPARPHRSIFHPFAVSNDAVITIRMVEDEKRHHAVVADNVVFTDVDRVVIKKAKDYVRIGFPYKNNYYFKALRFFRLKLNQGG
jgi:NAD+ kinase